MASKKIPWRPFYDTLTAEQKDMMLRAILEWQVDELRYDADVCFREAEDDMPSDFYWNHSGDSLIGVD